MVKAWRKIFLLSSSFVAPSQANLPQNEPNIKIVAEQLDCDQSRSLCMAKGKASAEKLNDPKTKILKADLITAHFTKDTATGITKVTRLEAEGNVFFILDDIIGQGERADYAVETEVAEIFGDVKITSGQNQMNGSYGRVDTKTGTYSLKREGGRVQALIGAKQEKK